MNYKQATGELQPKLYETLDEAKEAVESFQDEFMALCNKHGLGVVWLTAAALLAPDVSEKADCVGVFMSSGETVARISLGQQAINAMRETISELQATQEPCQCANCVGARKMAAELPGLLREAPTETLGARRPAVGPMGPKAAKRGPWDAG